MKNFKTYLIQLRSLLCLVASQLQAQPPIMLFVAAAWFGLVALALPWLLRLLLFVSPVLSGLLTVWAVVHLVIGLGKMAIGLRMAKR